MLTTVQLIKLVFFIRLVLTTWAYEANWLPPSYLLYNGVILILLGWHLLHRDYTDSLELAMTAEAVAILLDIVTLIIHYRSSIRSSRFTFSAVMCFFNLFTRPLAVMLLRMHTSDSANTLFSGAGRSGTYEDLEHSNPSPTLPAQVVPTTIDVDPYHK